MMCLLVEDNAEKVERIIVRLISDAKLPRENIEVAFTGQDAKRFLRSQVYDLMILDIVLPQRAGDKPTTETAIDLLTELRDRRTLKRPRHIIGLTAFEEGRSALQSIFSQQTWTIIKYDLSSSDWSGQLISAVKWIDSSDKEPSPVSYGCDLAIITALDIPEYDAVLRNGWTWSAAEPLDDTTFFRSATFQSGGRTYNAVSVYCPKMGMVSASLISAKLIFKKRPKFLVMSGICAGIKGKVNYGDPVIADPCWDWQRGKHVVKDGTQEFEMRPEQIPLAHELRSRWEQFKADKEYWSRLKQEWPNAPETELKIRLGPSVSGSAVLADTTIVEAVKNQHGALISLEMEAYGVLSAATLAARPRPIAFSCKSVCDFADEKKDDRWQSYASFTSARSISQFFERYMIELDFA